MFRKFIIALAFIFMFMAFDTFAQTASEIQRSQELLEQERLLREKLEQKEEKFFIKKITLKGVTLLSQAQIKEIILPFQKHWLTQKDIAQLLDLFKGAYKNKGYAQEPLKISYEVKKDKTLEIAIQELSH